jgi:hypothetical protein
MLNPMITAAWAASSSTHPEHAFIIFVPRAQRTQPGRGWAFAALDPAVRDRERGWNRTPSQAVGRLMKGRFTPVSMQA